MAILLITRPHYERTTRYLYYWSKRVIDFAKKNKHQIVDLKQKRVTRENLERLLGTMNPLLILLNGHGKEDVVFGHENEPVIVAGENDHLLTKKFVYALSCKTAQKLGKACVKNGTITYIGYNEDFMFWLHDAYNDAPLADPRAKLFFEPSNLIPIALLEGATPEQACQKARDAFLKNIQQLVASNSPELFMKEALVWNMLSLDCLGSQIMPLAEATNAS